MQPPVRIKLYGLISMTKRAYLRWWVAVGVAGVILLLLFWAVTVGPPSPAEKVGASPLTPLYMWRNYTPWFLVIVLLVQAIETCLVLRRFRRAEAEQQTAKQQPTTPQGK
jgi:hypothetical protein